MPVIAVALALRAASAGRTPVHPAPRPAAHRWRPARLPAARPGPASPGLVQRLRLCTVHFGAPVHGVVGHFPWRLKSETRSRLGHLYVGTVHDTLKDFTSPDRFLGYDNDTHSLADLESFGGQLRDLTINDPHRLRFNPALHLKKAFFTWEVVPLDEFRRSAFYNEFARPIAGFGGLVAVTTCRGGNIINLAFFRSESDPLFDNDDKRLLSVFLPHIWRSLDVHQRLLTANTQASLLRNSFDALQSAIVLLRQNGKVIFVNRAAEELIGRCAELCLRRDRLCATNHADSLKLEQLIKNATGGNGRLRLGEGMTIRRETGDRLQIIAAPVPIDSQAMLMCGLGPVAMLVIHDPDRRPHVPHETVAVMFGLTPSEARLLLALSQGQSLTQYADETHITQNTARTHLKSVFAKTNASKQSDLVRLMNGITHSVVLSE